MGHGGMAQLIGHVGGRSSARRGADVPLKRPEAVRGGLERGGRLRPCGQVDRPACRDS